VLCAAADICQSELEKKQQKLSFDLQAVQTQVLGDSARLQQVFWNILKNASKFTPAQGEIFLGSSNEPGVVIITIRDNGIGIAPGELKNIFEAFRQGDGTIAREFGGLGLGLAIAKATVDHLGGEIFAQSNGPGTGSTFTVRLPLRS
jgi:signal transduction histidine kinase